MIALLTLDTWPNYLLFPILALPGLMVAKRSHSLRAPALTLRSSIANAPKHVRAAAPQVVNLFGSHHPGTTLAPVHPGRTLLRYLALRYYFKYPRLPSHQPLSFRIFLPYNLFQDFHLPSQATLTNPSSTLTQLCERAGFAILLYSRTFSKSVVARFRITLPFDLLAVGYRTGPVLAMYGQTTQAFFPSRTDYIPR